MATPRSTGKAAKKTAKKEPAKKEPKSKAAAEKKAAPEKQAAPAKKAAEKGGKKPAAAKKEPAKKEPAKKDAAKRPPSAPPPAPSAPSEPEVAPRAPEHESFFDRKTPTTGPAARKKTAAETPFAKKTLPKPHAPKAPTEKMAEDESFWDDRPTPLMDRVLPTKNGDVGARIAGLWQRLEAWAAANTGRSLELRPGASEATIAEAERTMGLTFPAGFRASLALHDGQTAFESGSETCFPWMPGCAPLAPVQKMLEQWKEVQALADEYPPPAELDNDDHLRSGVYRKGRIPIAGTRYWDGDNVYLDLDPGPKGTAGQLITTVTECDFVVLDRSFEAALERWVTALEDGSWIYDRDENAEHPRDEKPHSNHPSNWFARA
jgi:cell wall assembly regulator SMI1